LEEERMLSVQKGSQKILEIKRKKFWMLYMWYITLKKDLCSEECRKSCIIKMYSSAKVRGPRRNPDDFRTYNKPYSKGITECFNKYSCHGFEFAMSYRALKSFMNDPLSHLGFGRRQRCGAEGVKMSPDSCKDLDGRNRK
jgi:hypothetical protein